MGVDTRVSTHAVYCSDRRIADVFGYCSSKYRTIDTRTVHCSLEYLLSGPLRPTWAGNNEGEKGGEVAVFDLKTKLFLCFSL